MALILTTRPIDGPIHLIDEDTGQKTQINVIAVEGQQVRLSFKAEDNISILRDKVYQREYGK